MEKVLTKVFQELNYYISKENKERSSLGAPLISPVEVKVLGQITLLANVITSKILSLQETRDLDATLENSNSFVKRVLNKVILPKYNLILDDDSELVWIPPKSSFIDFFDLLYVRVVLLDSESALVSKAVKAPKKNKILITEALASEKFPNLYERIIESGGNMKIFLGEDDEE